MIKNGVHYRVISDEEQLAKQKAEKIASSLLLSLSVGVAAGCYLQSFSGAITAFMISLVYLVK